MSMCESEFITIKAETIDPTGVVVTKAKMMLENTVPRDGARILLEIGDCVWMTTDKGLTMKRIVPREDEPEFVLGYNQIRRCCCCIRFRC